MNQNKIDSHQEEVSFVDVLRMLCGKTKTVVCITLILAIIGAVAGFVFTELTSVYGAEITFYLTPKENSQVLLPILQSEAFAEKLLLDENGLPPIEDCDSADYAAALAAVTAEKEAREEKLRLSKAIIAYPYELAIIEAEYNNLNNERVRIHDLLKMYKSAQDEIAKQPDHLAKIAEYEQRLAEVEQAWRTYKTEKYDPAVSKKLQLEEEYYLAKRTLKDARETADELVEKVLSKWRENEDVRNLVSVIQRSVTYEYTKILDNTTANQKVENQNTSFLVITVAVERDSEMAETIVQMIKERTPSFVEKEIERITGEAEAECTLTSTFVEAKDTGDSSLIQNLIIFGVIGAVLGAAFACVGIVVTNLLPEDLRPQKNDKKNKKAADKAQ